MRQRNGQTAGQLGQASMFSREELLEGFQRSNHCNHKGTATWWSLVICQSLLWAPFKLPQNTFGGPYCLDSSSKIPGTFAFDCASSSVKTLLFTPNEQRKSHLSFTFHRATSIGLENFPNFAQSEKTDLLSTKSPMYVCL